MEAVDRGWRTSSYGGNGGECVEVGQDADGTVLVRDTTQHGDGPVHRYRIAQWSAFVASIRAGRCSPNGCADLR